MIIKRDEAFRVVCYIKTQVDDGYKFGTGIFVYVDEKNKWIVTASHIAKNTTKQSLIFYCDDNNNSVKIDLASLCSDNEWKHHSIADVAVIKINDNKNILTSRCFPLNHINIDKVAPSRDYELTAIGFPLGYGIDNKFYLLTFRSYAASNILKLNPDNKETESDFFLLEKSCAEGYSGCPVFDLGYKTDGFSIATKDKTVCYGIMYGNAINNKGEKMMSMVTPSYYIRDLIKF